jgi:hypothetical protein
MGNPDILPIILYDIDNKIIQPDVIISNHCFYFYSYQIFSVSIVGITNVSILDGNLLDAVLYNVMETYPNLTITKGYIQSGNSGYTLFIKDNLSVVRLEITSITGIKSYWTVQLKDTNLIYPENDHYTDLLYNYHLPDYDELHPAMFENRVNKELAKRLLLDFRWILKYKGTTMSINQFLNFVGFDDETIKIWEEYITPSGEITETPNTLEDVKTGNYHIGYENYRNEGLDAKNLPIRKFIYTDFTKFFEHLLAAIALANKYFTSIEQEINFLGITFSSNIYIFQSFASDMCMNFFIDVNYFRKYVAFDLINYLDSDEWLYVVKNDVQKLKESYLSEVKFYKEEQLYNPKLFFIDREIYDDEFLIEDVPIEKYKRVFGNILHLFIKNILEDDLYCDITIQSENYPENVITVEKYLLSQGVQELIYCATLPDKYKITIKLHDGYNNVELYEYEYLLDIENIHVDFEIFSSAHIIDNPESISSDIDSPSEILLGIDSLNYILPIEDVPDNLSEYYNTIFDKQLRWLSDNKRFNIPPFNQNIIMEDSTVTIPLEFVDEWIEMISFNYREGYSLYLKVWNVITGEYDYIPYMQTERLRYYYGDILDCLYITVGDFILHEEQRNISEKFYMIMTAESGLSIEKSLYDFVLLPDVPEDEELSIYDFSDLNRKYLPVNYDFPLFPINPNTYISDMEHKDEMGNNLIRSIYPRLRNIKLTTQNLCLGDIIVCRLDTRYIVEEKNLVWKISNAFTNEILLTTNDYALKYRIDDNIIYNIECEFYIGAKIFKIPKFSVFTSFKKTVFFLKDKKSNHIELTKQIGNN